MEFESLSRDVISCINSNIYGCSFLEIFTISITEEEFELMESEGLNVRVNTDYQDTSNVFNIPSTVFQAHHRNIENYMQR